MNTTYISASELKRNVSEILNSVYYKKNITVVERFGKAIVKILPIEEKRGEERTITKILDSYFGVLPSFPEIKNKRNFRRRNTIL